MSDPTTEEADYWYSVEFSIRNKDRDGGHKWMLGVTGDGHYTSDLDVARKRMKQDNYAETQYRRILRHQLIDGAICTSVHEEWTNPSYRP